nr:MAG TPA: Cro/C1-type HTH DNA-binding domain protein [Caudoviricetes sp.]
MVNTNKLQGVMKEKRISVQDLAKKIGVSATTLYRIIQNDGKSFTVAQVEIIKEILCLDNAALVEIFLA